MSLRRVRLSESPTTMKSTMDHFPFLRLPTEIRLQIYEYLLRQRSTWPWSLYPYSELYHEVSTSALYPEIIQTNKKIYNEAVSIPYSQNAIPVGEIDKRIYIARLDLLERYPRQKLDDIPINPDNQLCANVRHAYFGRFHHRIEIHWWIKDPFLSQWNNFEPIILGHFPSLENITLELDNTNFTTRSCLVDLNRYENRPFQQKVMVPPALEVGVSLPTLEVEKLCSEVLHSYKQDEIKATRFELKSVRWEDFVTPDSGSSWLLEQHTIDFSSMDHTVVSTDAPPLHSGRISDEQGRESTLEWQKGDGN